MTTTRGIAGSSAPEVDGIFVCPDTSTVDFFVCPDTSTVDFVVGANNSGGPVDVWAIDDVHEADLVESSFGFDYLPSRIAEERLTLVQQDLSPTVRTEADLSPHDGGYESTLTISLDELR